jgi:hypothetical protein
VAEAHGAVLVRHAGQRDALAQVEAAGEQALVTLVAVYRALRLLLHELLQLGGQLPVRLDDHCLGSIAEIFDGDAPFRPGGCVTQAWSVSETLRAWHELGRAR